MKVSSEDLARVAKLSRLSVAPDEENAYIKDLNAIVTYVENLSTLNTDNVEPTTYALPLKNVFRDDAPKASLTREAALKNAPDAEDGYFKVPRVLEE